MKSTVKLDWVDVTSSNISQVAYNPDSRVFCVRFRDGGVYSYDGVDRDIFNTIQTVPSVGRYFNMMVKAYHDHLKWANEAGLVDHIQKLIDAA